MFLIFPAEKQHPARRTKTTLPPGKKTSHAITRHTLHDTNITSKFFTAANTFAPVNATNIQFLLDFSYKSEYRHAHTDTRKQTLYILMSMPAYLPPRNALLSRYTSKKLDGSEHLELLCEGKRSDYVQQQSVECHFAGSDSWVILSPIEQSIKRKIEAVGTPLKDWDINIYRGVLTGYNDAFIINTEKRDEILSNCQTEDECTRTAELIRPILRGRDIKRYGYNWANLWLIYIPWHFPLQFDESITGASEKAETAFQEQYPAVYQHMLEYKEPLSKRNKAETGIRYEWYAMQRWGAKYWEDFSKPKIMYPNMTKYIPFYFDEKNFLQNDKSFMITGKHIAYLTAFLNSSIFKFCFLDKFPELQGGTRELRKIFFDKIPVLEISDEENIKFQSLITEIQNEYKREKAIQIDKRLFELYGLTKEECEIIGFVEIQ